MRQGSSTEIWSHRTSCFQATITPISKSLTSGSHVLSASRLNLTQRMWWHFTLGHQSYSLSSMNMRHLLTFGPAVVYSPSWLLGSLSSKGKMNCCRLKRFLGFLGHQTRLCGLASVKTTRSARLSGESIREHRCVTTLEKTKSAIAVLTCSRRCLSMSHRDVSLRDKLCNTPISVSNESKNDGE